MFEGIEQQRLLYYNSQRIRNLSKMSQTFGNTFPIEVFFQFKGAKSGSLR